MPVNVFELSSFFLCQSLFTKLLRYIIFVQFLSWRREKRFQKTLESMESTELSSALRLFFVEARKVEGKPYSRDTIKTIRVGLDWFLSCSPHRLHRQTFSIIRGK